MPKYIFVYLGGEQPSDPVQGKKHFEKYQDWLNALGKAVLSPAIPFKDTHTIQANGKASPGTMSTMSGFSIIQLNSMEDALEAAKVCPFLEINGTLEVSEMIEMSGDLDSENSKTIN